MTTYPSHGSPSSKYTRWGPLTTISGFIPSYTQLQPWLNRVCWGYNFLIIRGAPSCTSKHRGWKVLKVSKTPRFGTCVPRVTPTMMTATPGGRDLKKPTDFLLWGKVFCLDCSRLGSFKYFFIFIPKIGEDEPILTSIFFEAIGSTTN